MSAKEVPWEVLPPEAPKSGRPAGRLYDWVALVMDELIRVPGTRFRFGLDPVIGLIPGLGDTASALISALCLIYAARCGIPRITLARMSLNILINEVVGIVPGLGDAFSFWFKSNVRNRRLLEEHLNEVRKPRRGDWIFVGIILGAVFVVVVIGLAVSLLIVRQLIHMLQG
jgi:uncharacterized protein DUF4112